MTRVGSSASARVWEGLFLLVFVISIVGVGALTVYHIRRPSVDVYAISGGSGELWLTLIAIIGLGGFLIVFSDEQLKGKERPGEQRDNPP